jgi:hypothetical protein
VESFAIFCSGNAVRRTETREGVRGDTNGEEKKEKEEKEEEEKEKEEEESRKEEKK